MRTSFSYLGTGWTDYAEIRCVVIDPLAKRFTEVDVRYVRTCASLLRISGTAGRAALKFGVWLGDQRLCVLLRMGDSALTQVQLSHIQSHLFDPARSSPKRRLTGYSFGCDMTVTVAMVVTVAGAMAVDKVSFGYGYR